jgi:hypothetical protein
MFILRLQKLYFEWSFWSEAERYETMRNDNKRFQTK